MAGSHLISIVPHPHRLSFGNLSHAVQLARKWAGANGASIWHSADGHVVQVLPDEYRSLQ
jgi:hypothetical protein